MDIKDLNKSQLILLAILLSFITSIATGIVTVTLMQQAPESITMPINRVVRETVEKIVPAPGKETVQTVIIKEEDLVVDAIAKNQLAVFSITKEVLDLDGKTIEVEAGRGFAVSDAGIIVADGSLVFEGQIYYVKNDSGKFKTDFLFIDKSGFSFLKIGVALNGTDKLSFKVPTFGDLSIMKAGQKILILGNTISSFIFEGTKDIKINVIESNKGGLVFNLDGDVLGIALSNNVNSFVSIGLISEVLKTLEIKQ